MLRLPPFPPLPVLPPLEAPPFPSALESLSPPHAVSEKSDAINASKTTPGTRKQSPTFDMAHPLCRGRSRSLHRSAAGGTRGTAHAPRRRRARETALAMASRIVARIPAGVPVRPVRQPQPPPLTERCSLALGRPVTSSNDFVELSVSTFSHPSVDSSFDDTSTFALFSLGLTVSVTVAFAPLTSEPRLQSSAAGLQLPWLGLASSSVPPASVPVRWTSSTLVG